MEEIPSTETDPVTITEVVLKMEEELASVLSRPRSQVKDRIFLLMATQLGLLSTCNRARVGAIITIDSRCVCWGFNGAPPGLPHCEENNHGHGYGSVHAHNGCRNATHAEANALAFAARSGISTEGSTLYVTITPCEACARLLIAAGITRVVSAQPYRDDAGVKLLKEAWVTIG